MHVRMFRINFGLVTDPFLASSLRWKVTRHDIRGKALKRRAPKDHLKPFRQGTQNGGNDIELGECLIALDTGARPERSQLLAPTSESFGSEHF